MPKNHKSTVLEGCKTFEQSDFGDFLKPATIAFENYRLD
jgi:hypothetical protein